MKRTLLRILLGGVYIIEFVLVWFLASPKSVAYDYEITQAIVVKEEVQTCLVCEQEKGVEQKEQDQAQEHVQIQEYEQVQEHVQENEITCKHDLILLHNIKEATCAQKGSITYVCAECNAVVYQEDIDMLDCAYGEWIYEKYATPLEEERMYKQCTSCGNVVYETYQISMAGDNSIYVSGVINKCVTIASLDRYSGDTYDIVYAEDRGENDPLVFGCNYRSLGVLYQIDVGDYIYLCINGRIEKYKVVLSEYSRDIDSGKDIVGVESGTSIFQNYGCKTLHLYTCYGDNEDGRWLVLAVLE